MKKISDNDYISLSDDDDIDLSANNKKANLKAYSNGKLQPFLCKLRKEECASKIQCTTTTKPEPADPTLLEGQSPVKFKDALVPTMKVRFKNLLYKKI